MTSTELHALRSAQLKALYLDRFSLSAGDYDAVMQIFWQAKTGFDTRNLSDKALEEIQTLAGKYLEQVS